MSLSLWMLCICPSAARLTSYSPTNPWHLLAVCFVFLPPLTMAQLSWRPRLARCFFLERWQEWVFWQRGLPWHLIISSSLCCSQAQSPSSCCMPQREVVRLGSHRSSHPELCAAATTTSAGPQSQAAAPRSHRSWALLIHGFCCHSKGRVLVYLMSHSGWLSQKHCSWKKAVSLSIRLLQLLKSGGWVRVYTSLQREDSSLLQKEETECYLSKLGMLYANNYMLQGTFFYIYKLSSLDAMEGRQFQVLTRASLT